MSSSRKMNYSLWINLGFVLMALMKINFYQLSIIFMFAEYSCRTDIFKYIFFSYTITEWNELASVPRNAKSYSILGNSLLKLCLPNSSLIYNINDPLDIKLLTRLNSVGVGSIPVGGNSPSVGGWIVRPPVIQQ